MANQQIENSTKRQFGLSSFAVDNATSIFLIAFMILLFGLVSYQSMPKEQYPEVDLPTVYINTPYFGNSAEDIENLVTRPIEKELQSITGVKDIKSTSIQDYSVITAEFESDIDIDDAVKKVKDAVDKAKGALPNDLDAEPTILDINLSEIPIVTVNVAGDYTNDELLNYAEYLEEQIEELDEISSVELKGNLDREVKVDVDLPKMEAVKVSFQDIQNAISSENITMSGGELVNNNFRRAVRIAGEFENVDEIRDLIVKSEDQRPIYLNDIATVTYGYAEKTSIARMDGLPVISLDVIKRSGENLLNASDRIKEIVEEARQKLPEDLNISLFNDQSVNTRNQVNNLENSIISGVILVTLVLLFFLGIRNASFVGIAIPLSMLMGILFLSISGVTLNIMVLFALILALGLLVDNAIVVVENIYRYMQNGYKPIAAAKYGAGEVAMPIIASTATTLAAFIPLAFWPGILGSFLLYLPVTLIIVLASSLFVALIINPVFAASFMKVDERSDDRAVRVRKTRNVLIGAGIVLLVCVAGHFANVLALRNLMGVAFVLILTNHFVLRPASFTFQGRILPILERGYDRFIGRALKVPILIFGGSFMLLFLAIGILAWRSPKVDFFTSASPIYVNAFIELPLGADIEATNMVSRQVEQRIQKVITPYDGVVEAVLLQIGENTSDPNGPPEPGASPNKARLTVSFVPFEERGGISTYDIMEDIRNAARGIPGVQIVVDKNADGPITGKPINLEIQGESMDSLAILSDRVINFINRQSIPGIEELQADVQIGKPELLVRIDRTAARRYEISTFDIANTIRTAIFGREVSKFKDGEDDYPIMLRLEESYRNNIEQILNTRVTFRSPATGRIVQVPISAVADIEYSSTYSAIKRKNLDRVVTIYSNVLEGYNANEIVAEIDKLMAGYNLPDGYNYEFTGEQQQQAEDLGFLSLAFSIALFAIFIIIVAQFNSISSPFIIILSVLFSTIGVFLGYAFSGMTISVIFTGLGIISLAGIVVNNAIVLIDYTNILIRDKVKAAGVKDMYGLPIATVKKAIEEGGATRLRPVLLTAITTVLGLLPLAIGFNINFFTLITEGNPNFFIGGDNTAFWGPLAWAVIYGLVFATFLTLVVVPAMFFLTYRLNRWVRAVFRSKSEVEVEPVSSQAV
ncbi:MAG: efflux RND transporter permease subunit [Saprospiraceae bacterium]|nr:efflux RND transporter permease subunit [Saprospiraceae bacterium]